MTSGKVIRKDAQAVDWTTLGQGGALVNWAMTAPHEAYFPGTARPMPETVDYRFRNGWVDTGDLPCREALLAAVPGREIARPAGPFDAFFPGLDGANVDFSRFCHRPTLIVRGFRCLLQADNPGPARFRIATCGGVRLWLGDAPVAVFEPFTRNTPQTTDITLDLPAGKTELTVRLEDLHERDTTCYFALTYLDGPELRTAVDITADPQALAEAAALLDVLRPDAVFYEDGIAHLVADPPPARPVTVHIEGLVPFLRGGISTDPETRQSFDVTLTPDAPSAKLYDTATAPLGCLNLQVSLDVDGTRLTRQLGTTNLPAGIALTGNLGARKTQAADLIAHGAGFDPSVALLLAMRGEAPAKVARILNDSLITIEQRYDCSDFSILPLLRLWRDARDALDPALQARLRDAILGYRYWLDEPGDDVMWFWSENHVLCFHTAQLIAGTLFPYEVFPNSGKTGTALRADAHARLIRWFASIKAHGLCEWNSAAYYPIDLLGLFTLHDMAPDLRDQAASLMDRIFVMTGLHTTGGSPAGSQGRCYEKELLAGPATELGPVVAIAFKAPFRVGYDRASTLFCLSDYAPPAVASAFAQPAKGDQLEARYSQGLDHAGKLTLWKSADVQLSTVDTLVPGDLGHQAQVLDVKCAGHPMARLWINHPGDVKPWGERRPSLLAGNHVMPRVAQVGPLGLMIYDLDRDWTDLHFTQLFAPAAAFNGPVIAGDWRVFSCADAHIGVWCSHPITPVDGFHQGALYRAYAPQQAWAVSLATPDEDRADFTARLITQTPVFDAQTLTLHTGALRLDFATGLHVDGQPAPFAPMTAEPHLSRNGAPMHPWTEARYGA